MDGNSRSICLVALTAMLCSVSISFAQSGSAPAPQAIPSIDGGIGPCSLDVTVNSSDGKPVYAASVKVHIAYGFGGFHKLDLDGGTNADGKLKFKGLPNRVRRPPLEFEASKDSLSGTATVDPAVQCRAQRTIVIEKPKPGEER